MTECDNSNVELLNFPPLLRNVIQEIQTDSSMGITSRPMKIHLYPSKRNSKPYTDSLTVEIPYAGNQLFWEVTFKDEDYNYPPDFEFPDTFLHDPDIDVITEYIPSLANWNVDNPKSLVEVIRELLLLYKKYQLDRLSTENKFAKVYEEYNSLVPSEANTFKDDLEVYIDHSSTVYFLLSFNINFSRLPPYAQMKLTEVSTDILNPNEDTATLKISFLKPDCSKVHCELHLSPRLEQVVGNSTKLHLPPFNRDSKVKPYVLQVKKLLEDKVKEVAHHYRMKNEYISSILTVFGYGVIEYDSVLFSQATLLCEVDNFHTIVCISIGDKFPQEKPKVTLRSVYHTQSQSDKPTLQELTHYPYSPRWSAEEMWTRLITFLNDEIAKFQTK